MAYLEKNLPLLRWVFLWEWGVVLKIPEISPAFTIHTSILIVSLTSQSCYCT